MPSIVVQVKLVTGQAAGIVEMEDEPGLFSGEDRFDMARTYLQLRHVAESVQHGHTSCCCKEEGEYVTQAQRVIDIAQQHQYQHKGESEALPGRDNIDAALVEYQRATLDRAAEGPVAEFMFEGG
jgi:hypothetical protein